MTSPSRRYAVVYSPEFKAFVIHDADLDALCGLDGEVLKFRTILAARAWLADCRAGGLDDSRTAEDDPRTGRAALRHRAADFLAAMRPVPLNWEDFIGAGQGT